MCADASGDYGVRPGAMIAGAEVYLVDKAAPDVAVQGGGTNDSRRAEMEIKKGPQKTNLETWVICE
jgi:hypothetical protein